MFQAKFIDLRSDTVTIPTTEMLESILHAPLGDDIMGEDPTVNKLQKEAAELLGMEDALLVISGTMANQIAIMTYCNRGEEILMGEDSHIYTMEGAATSAVAQVQIRPFEVSDGYYDVRKMEQLIQKGDLQRPKTSLICLENTYNLNKGQVISLENMKEVRALANQYGLPVFLDGARIFNAATELNVFPAEICQEVDAVQFCLTKGLGCPIGSILAGSKQFIEEAKINRQRLGGGMRQAGIIAAPALYALNHMINRLPEDHKKAKEAAARIAEIDGFHIQLSDVQSNIIAVDVCRPHWNANLLIDYLLKKGIKVKNIGTKRVRLVIHYEISETQLEHVIEALQAFSIEM